MTIRSGLLAAGTTAALLWLALPGGGEFWPLLFIALVPFFAVLFRGDARQAAGFGLVAGTAHFLVQLYWIVIVLGQYGGIPPYLSVPALMLLAVYMGSYLVLFALFGRVLVRNGPVSFAMWLLPCLWVGLDWLRSFLFSGFPWMDLGYGLAESPLLAQSADIWGHHGLTFVIVLINVSVALFLFGPKRKKGAALFVPVALLIGAVGLYSVLRLQFVDARAGKQEKLVVAVVQGNVDQAQKWLPAIKEKTVLDYLRQSRKAMTAEQRPRLVVWPETALPFYPTPLSPLFHLVRGFALDEGVMLLTGAPWYELVGEAGREVNYFNSSLLFDRRGNLVGRTSKAHLVPFGEYVPLKRFLPFLEPLVEAVGDFTPGKIQNPPACQKARIGVLICFESIFPDIARKWVDQGATLLVNLTNDAWYGRSSAPYQSLAMTRLRAIETRRSVVRAANTGFSGFVDPAGRLQSVSPLFVSWESVVPVQLSEERSLFVRGGYLFAPACLIVFAGISGLLMLTGKNKKHTNNTME